MLMFIYLFLIKKNLKDFLRQDPGKFQKKITEKYLPEKILKDFLRQVREFHLTLGQVFISIYTEKNSPYAIATLHKLIISLKKYWYLYRVILLYNY